MSFPLRSLGRRFLSTSSALLPLCLGLEACGGGGGVGIASIPPPSPAPPPQEGATIDVKTAWLNSPATRPGQYGVLGRLTLNGDQSTSTSAEARRSATMEASTSR